MNHKLFLEPDAPGEIEGEVITPDPNDSNLPDRNQAISAVWGAFMSQCNEFCAGTCTCSDEVDIVLRALGVTDKQLNEYDAWAADDDTMNWTGL